MLFCIVDPSDEGLRSSPLANLAKIMTVYAKVLLFAVVFDNSAVYDPTGLLALLREAQRQAHEHGVDNLSEEEIEAEIRAYRAERKKRLGL